jgi:triphosphoribosyl-dephospho-CoA synthase
MPPKTGKQIAQLIQMACVLEACAPKPGNVNRRHDFSDTSLEDFLVSAIAVGPAFENAGPATVGQIILDAVTETHRHVQSNTNLGMILLFAPLAKACLGVTNGDSIRPNLNRILNSLTVDDARLAYTAIRHAQPGGMGKVLQSDVAEAPSVTLLQAMALAQNRDSIAREYVTGFAITFDIGLPAMKEGLSRSGNFPDAIVQAFLTILSKAPDTLIARKKGNEAAQKASQSAAKVLAKGGVFTREGQDAIAEMDRALRDNEHRLNPGTTADLTTAALFLALFGGSPGITSV